MKKVISTSFEQTQELGKEFAQSLQGGEIVCLYGDLGAGKTTFAQGVAEGLGVSKKIISPTFIIMRTYKLYTSSLSEQSELKDSGHRQNQAKNFYHVDLYRIAGERDFEGLGLTELMGNPENIVLIEWPDKAEKALPDKRINIFFRYLKDEEREIHLS